MTLLIGALSLMGCNESRLDVNRPPDDPGIPSIAVMPPALEWGQLTADESETQMFTVRNIGDVALAVGNITIEGVEAYTILTPTSFLVDRDSEVNVEVQFSPIVANNDAIAVVWSDDPDEPASQVQLTGLGSVPELSIVPEIHDFGDLLVPCDDAVELTLSNTGAEPLEITEIQLAGTEGLELVDDNALPVTLAVGEATEVDVYWTALTNGPASSTLSVTSNDPRGIVTATQAGNGTFSATARETLTIDENPPVDILFAVDQSCSMDVNTNELNANFASFISEIDAVTNDWQIGVPNFETGCFNSGLITQTTPNYTGVFSAAALLGEDPGGTTSYSEKLLQLSEVALNQTGAGQCNAGFPRPGALFHIILVSDEPNRSPRPWASYQADFESYLTDPDLLRVSGVLDVSDCGLGSLGYPDIVTATDGVLLDLCGNWSSQVSALGQVSVEAVGELQLQQLAEPTSVEVSRNGSSLTTGWSYDPIANSVSFDPPLDEGESADVDYAVLAVCE